MTRPREAEAMARRLAAAVALHGRLERLGVRPAGPRASSTQALALTQTLDRAQPLDPPPTPRDWLLVASFGSVQEPAGVVAPPRIMMGFVVGRVAKTTGIDEALLTSEARNRPIAEARHLAMYLARALCGISYARIGQRLGGRDHTTAIHGIRAAMRRLGLPRPEQLPRAVALQILLDGPPAAAADLQVQHGR